MMWPKPTKANRLPKPLRRKRPMRKRRSRRVASQTPADRAFLAWLHLQWCRVARLNIAPEYAGCDGSIQAAHFRDHTGLGLKAATSTCIPMCRRHHEDYDQHKGYFAGMSRDELKAWHRWQQFETQTAYAQEG